MRTLRLNFSKTGDAKYISHLDLNRCFTRAFRRSGLDLWYTEGFNSHLYLLFALPLALGLESISESLDIKMDIADEDIDISERINPYLPRGIRAFNSFFPKYKHKDIAFARYFIEIADDGDYIGEFLEASRRLTSQETIVVEKKGKNGVSMIDIRPQIHDIGYRTGDNTLLVDLLVDAGNSKNLNPMLFLGEVNKLLYRKPKSYRILRMQILTEGGVNFE